MKKECPATMESKAEPGHTHSCIGAHDARDHFCGECRRYWWQAPQGIKSSR